jgi:hypothetical protein
LKDTSKKILENIVIEHEVKTHPGETPTAFSQRFLEIIQGE